MIRSDKEIYNDIGSLLLSVTPGNVVKIIAHATLEPESDCGKFTYDYVDKHGVQYWVTETGNASEKLLDFLIELRKYFIANFNSQEKPFWHGCEITVDIDTLKINIDFKYDN